MLLLRCPKCGHDMKYQEMSQLDRKKAKRCVYCGKSFKVVDHIVKKIS